MYIGKAPSGQRLYVRHFDRTDPVALAGTDGASLPFFSPDGQWVGFRQGDKLVRVPLAGGPVSLITTLTGVAYGATWARGDTVIFGSDSGLMEVPVSGGTPRLIARPDSGEAFRFPEVLPDGRTVLFGVMATGSLNLAALTRRTGSVKRFQQPGGYPRYIDAGFVVLSNVSGSLTAVRFDARRLEIRGAAISLAAQLTSSPDGDVNLGVSRAGDLAFQASTTAGSQLLLVGRDGATRAFGQETGYYHHPRLSPDGKRVAISQSSDFGFGSADVWVFDLTQRTRTRITFDTTDHSPLWTPDGGRIAYTRAPQGIYGQVGNIYWVPADGSAKPESLLVQPASGRPRASSPMDAAWHTRARTRRHRNSRSGALPWSAKILRSSSSPAISTIQIRRSRRTATGLPTPPMNRAATRSMSGLIPAPEDDGRYPSTAALSRSGHLPEERFSTATVIG